MTRFAQLSRSQLRRRAKLFTAVWVSWLFVGEFIASLVPHRLEVPCMLVAMVPFVIAGRYGIALWYRAKTTPDLPRAELLHAPDERRAVSRGLPSPSAPSRRPAAGAR